MVLAGPRLVVQSILYHQSLPTLRRLVQTLAQSALLVRSAGRCSSVSLQVGDCSASPLLDRAQADALADGARALGLDDLAYTPFETNLGHGGGHNALRADGPDADYVLYVNPDAVVAPSTLDEMLQPFASRRAGVVEARQVPYEHPKEYDASSGVTPWSSFACAMVRREVLDRTGGFDAETFFLHGDDVDYSWRARLAGFDCVYHPAARVFHDKRPDEVGTIRPSEREEEEGSLGLMMLAYKYHHDDALERLRDALAAGSAHRRRAVDRFDERVRTGRLPDRLDPEHTVARFVGLDVAAVRF